MRGEDAADQSTVARLSRVVGRRVSSAEGADLGRLVDLVVDGHTAQPPVRALVIQARGRRPVLVPVADLIGLEPLVVRGGTPNRAAEDEIELADGEILLARDVLDTQVYDTTGQRIARVGDIDLECGPDLFQVLAVDTGFGAVCHRLGLHALGRRLGDRVVSWSELHLTSARGHLVQLSAPRAAVHRMTDEQLAGLLDRVTTTHGAEILASLPPARAASTLTTTGYGVVPRLVGAMSERDAEAVIDELPDEHAARVRATLRAHALRPSRRFLRHRPRRTAGHAARVLGEP